MRILNDSLPRMENSAVSEATYYAIFEACQEGILVVDQGGTIVISNKSLQDVFGYSAEELSGMKVENLIPSKYHDTHEHHRDRYMARPTPRKMGHARDLVGLRKDGKEFPVEASLSTVTLGGQLHTVAYIIDITARKEIEDALKQSEEQLVAYATELEKRVQSRTEQLVQSNKELEAQIAVRKQAEMETRQALERERKLNELKSRFVSTASHEFRTPLSTIKSSASLIERYKATEQEEKRQRHVVKIKNAIDHLNDILDDFLSLAKLEEGKVNTQQVTVDVEHVLNQLKEEIRPIFKKGQEMEINVDCKHPLVSDSKIIKNIMINLVSNAIKYSPEGSVIIVNATEHPDHHEIQIHDQGMGIPQEDQEHLFERFFRANNAVNIQGTGLGLHIVQKYVDLLGGAITFESKENTGTTFTVTIPKTYETNSHY